MCNRRYSGFRKCIIFRDFFIYITVLIIFVAMEQLVISTWKHGVAANEKAVEVLNNGGTSLDAVEQGVAAYVQVATVAVACAVVAACP